MTQKQQFKGIVTSQKLIKASDPTLVLFKLNLIDCPMNPKHLIHQDLVAIIARNPLTFLLEVQLYDRIIIYGHFNQRKQFVTERYLIEKHQTAEDELIANRYPKRKEY